MIAIYQEALGNSGYAAAMAVPRAESRDEIGYHPKTLEHTQERRRVTKVFKGIKVTAQDGKTSTMTEDVYWKLRELWIGGWEEGGREMIDAVIAATEGFKSKREKLCWANPPALMDIVRDTGGVNSEMSGDVTNMFRRHETCYTTEEPGKLNG